MGFCAFIGDPPELSYVDSFSTTAATNTLTIPASAAAGDIAVANVMAYRNAGGDPPEYVLPSGWTQIGHNTSGLARCISMYKILSSGEPGSGVTTMLGIHRSILSVFRGSSVIASVGSVSVSAGTSSSHSINVSAVNSPAIAISAIAMSAIGQAGSGSFAPSGMTLVGAPVTARLAYALFSPGVATTNLTATLSGGVSPSFHHSCYLALS